MSIHPGEEGLRRMALAFLDAPPATRSVGAWYLHDDAGRVGAVLVTPEHWDQLAALIPEGDEATTLYADHEHIEASGG
jgi:hypothetical protein